MVDLRDMRPKPTRPESRLWFGTFAADVPSLNTMAKVILPEFDEHHHWGPARWQSRDATTLPSKGDECIVVFDNRMNVWIVSWWPYV
jgi:hypothetical protein